MSLLVHMLSVWRLGPLDKNFIELAKLFRDRDNESFEPIAIGKVVSVSPLKINDGDDIMLDEELIITHTIQQLIQSSELRSGDNVVLIASSDNNTYIVIDKAVT